MRILIVGSDKVHAIENFFVKHMREYGVQVELFAATSIFYDYYYKSIVNKLMYRTGLSAILKKINVRLQQLIEKNNFDVVWVFKGMELFPETLQWIKSRNIPLAKL